MSNVHNVYYHILYRARGQGHFTSSTTCTCTGGNSRAERIRKWCQALRAWWAENCNFFFLMPNDYLHVGLDYELHVPSKTRFLLGLGQDCMASGHTCCIYISCILLLTLHSNSDCFLCSRNVRHMWTTFQVNMKLLQFTWTWLTLLLQVCGSRLLVHVPHCLVY